MKYITQSKICEKLAPKSPPRTLCPQKNITSQKNRQKEKALIYQGFSCVSYRLRSWIRAALPRKLRMRCRIFTEV